MFHMPLKWNRIWSLSSTHVNQCVNAILTQKYPYLLWVFFISIYAGFFMLKKKKTNCQITVENIIKNCFLEIGKHRIYLIHKKKR